MAMGIARSDMIRYLSVTFSVYKGRRVPKERNEQKIKRAYVSLVQYCAHSMAQAIHMLRKYLSKIAHLKLRRKLA